MNSIFFFFQSSPFNDDSSDNKRILSEASPRLLGHQRLVAIRYYHIDFFFRCHESPRSTSVNFCERFFYFNKKVCFKLDVVKFNRTSSSG